MSTVAALDRFRAKCVFEPETGCVVWIGGTTMGHGRTNNTRYGSFWFEGQRWLAHRWAAIFIHGLDVGADTVGHCCPYTGNGHPNPLCVEHLIAQTLADNVAERNVRRARQTAMQRLNWKMVELGMVEPPAVSDGWVRDMPVFDMPDWLRC